MDVALDLPQTADLQQPQEEKCFLQNPQMEQLEELTAYMENKLR